MKTTCFLWLALIAAGMLPSSSKATLTNIWPFTTPAQYSLSNSNDIEVADGVAKLRLQAVELHDSTVADYITNGTSYQKVGVGSDVALTLLRSGPSYLSPGVFASRILDGGDGTIWSKIVALASNVRLLNAGGGVSSTELGLVGLYRMDNNWNDSSPSALNLNTYASMSFSSDAALGSRSGRFGSGDVYGGALPLGSAFTVSFWAKPLSSVDSRTMSFAFCLMNGGTSVEQIRLGGQTDFVFTKARAISLIKVNDNQGATTASGTWTDSDVGSWQHVVIRWNVNLPLETRVTIFKNGVALPLVYYQLYSGLPTFTGFRIGSSGGGNQFDGLLDDFAVYNRALTDTEILQLYSRPRSAFLQVRSSTSADTIVDQPYTGPDGTTNTFYTGMDESLVSGEGFQIWHRYAQYRLYLYGQSDGTQSPFVDAVGLFGNRGYAIDNNVADFLRGSIVQNVMMQPAIRDAPYLGLAKESDGGYFKTGTYTSRVLDGGVPRVWQKLVWDIPAELGLGDSALLGLWHMNGGAADSAGLGFHGNPVGTVTYTPFAKLGSDALLLNGTSYLQVGTLGGKSMKTLEMWISDENVNDGIMEFGTNQYLSIAQRMVTPMGMAAYSPTVYVNGSSTARRLMPGWNHVAVTFVAGLSPSGFNIGIANGRYMEGRLDELAIYSRALSGDEIKAHYTSGRRISAGRAKFQVRGGNELPLGTGFVGPGDNPASYIIDNTGGGDQGNLPPSVINKRYIQYRAYFEGEGDATPTVGSVTCTYFGGGVFSDVSLSEFGLGTFDGDRTKWCGDEIVLPDRSVVPGLVNMDGNTAIGLEGLWHMDESAWGAGSTVLDSSPQGRNGQPFNGATVAYPPKLGSKCGSFDGINDYVSLPGFSLNGDFSILAWFKSAAASRSAILSRSDGKYVLEFNGDGVTVAPGYLAFSVFNGVDRKIVVSSVGGLNDGVWHHVAAIRSGANIYIYVDGTPVGSTRIGTTFGSLGSADAVMARHSLLSTYFGGNVDEVAIFGRAITEAELLQTIAAGVDTSVQGVYVSTVYDALRPAIWETIRWRTDARYELPLAADSTNLVGLWHLDEPGGSSCLDSSAAGNEGTIVGNVNRATGKFSTCLSLAGSGGYVQIADDASLEPSSLSVEAWVFMTDVSSVVVFDKRTATTGYALGTDDNGHPYFWVGGTNCVSQFGLRPQIWNHLAGVWREGRLMLYVNGQPAAVTMGIGLSLAGGNARIGLGYDAAGAFQGLIDEVAVYQSALGAEAVMDHARAGASRLLIQARASDSLPIEGANFAGPDGTSNTYFSLSSAASMVGSIPLGRYFQYRILLAADDGLSGPRFQGATINRSSYPTDNPWVMPADGYGLGFLGKLTDFAHVMSNNTDNTVRYQLSGNNGTNWHWWNGTQWENVTGFGWDLANYLGDINSHVDSFYDDLYPKFGGVFKFKAYLHSGGNDQVSIDRVSLGYSAGRLVVTVPNGGETNKEAWLIGVPYTIRWTSAGTVSSTLKIEYSLDSGNVWATIATNVANTGSYSVWTTPAIQSDRCRVRITDMNDLSISDLSDSDFSLVQRFRITLPNGGEKWYVGRSNTIRWMSAVGLGNLADLHYAADGENFTELVKFGAANIPGSTNNSFAWATPSGNPNLVSETGRIRVQTFGGTTGADASDEYFTLAGIEITKPPAGALVNRRQTYPVEWVAAGAGPAVAVDFSANSGATWTNVIASYTNQPGTNIFDWNPAVQPTDTARLRVRSLSDANVVGVSSNFVLADIDILAPTNGATWGMGLTNAIVWMAGGAGTNINIYYSTNSGGEWVPVAQRYRNTSGSNSYLWLVPPLPGSKTRVKIESSQDNNLFAISPDFNIAGVRIVSPNRNEKWEKDVPNSVQWEYQSVGEGATLEFSYDGGLSYRNIGGPGVPLINRALGYTPVYPTVRAKAKIIADEPAPFTNMFDESDAYFVVGGIQVTMPTTGTVYTLGTAGPVNWVSAGAEDPLGQARLSYASGGVTSQVAVVGNNEAFPGENSYTWNLSLQTDPSASARVIVKSGPYAGVSFPFTLRGMKFSSPNATSVYDVGGDGAVVWKSAGIDENANGYFYLSTDGGLTFATDAINSQQVWTVISGAYPWTIDPDENPVTNAVLKFVVVASGVPVDIGYEARSLPFVLRGMKVLVPSNGTVWAHGTTNNIVWRSARAGTVASLYYSADGIAYDTAPIAANVSLADGLNSYAWRIDASRMPSTNATIKVVSSAAAAVSRSFVLQGIKVTAPLGTDIWALDETNRISWVAVGTTPPYTISLIQGGTNVLPIATGVNDPEYDWVVPLAAVSSNAVIRVTDGRFTGDSPTFKIVGMPTVQTISPAPGELWKVSQVYNVVWSKGGKMDNDFHVMFSSAPYIATNDIFNGVANYNALDNTFSVPWTIPDRLGDTKIIIQHNTRSEISNVSEPFKIVPYFRIVYPNGGDTNLYSRKLSIVSWFTRGSQTEVDLYYSSDPLHGSNSWVKINTAPIANNGQGVGDVVTTYDWQTSDLGGDVRTVRLRVQATDVPGAYDDSDTDFSILYFKILWRVYDSATSNELTQLSVSDSSGWSQAGMNSPILRAYPFGVFDTVWAREYFYNNVIFNWASEPSRTIEVFMKRSDVEPDYNVMANFVYDPTNALFRVNSWIERRGRILLTPAKCVITVYDAAGNAVALLTSTTHDENGIYWQTLPPSLERGKVYFARVEIDYSAVVYSSGVTFNLRVPTAEEQALQMMNTLSNVLSGVNVLNTNLNDLAAAQAAFRASATGKLDFLTNTMGRIPGLTNLESKLDNYGTQTLSRLDLLTNTIGVIGPGETNNVLARLTDIAREIGGKSARILTRPTSVKQGAVVDILYRSQPGYAATIGVTDVGGGVVVAATAMTALPGGIFERLLTASWALGDYVITCEDTLGLSDKMILKVTALELDDVALSMGSVSGQLASIEFALDGMSASMSNVVTVVSTLGDLTNMADQVAIMTNSLAKVAALTNMPSQMDFVVSVIDKLTALTNMAPQLATMSTTMEQLAPMTNVGPQLSYLTTMVGTLSGLTNMPSQLDGVVAAVGQLGSLTNLGPQVDQLTSVIGQITALTNMSVQLNTMAATMDQLGTLTNLTPKVDSLTASLDQVVALTNLTGQMNGVVTAIGQLGSLTNLGPQVDVLSASMTQISALTNMASQMNQVIAAVNQLGSLTNLGPQVDVLSASMTQITALTNMASQMNQVIAAVNSLGSLTNLGPQVDVLTASMTQITALTNLAGQVTSMTTTLNGMTNLSTKVDQLGTTLSKVVTLTNMPAQVSAIAAAVGQLGSLTNLAGQVTTLSDAMGQIVGLTNIAGQVNGVTATLNSMTNLNDKVDSVIAGIGQLGSLTNLGGQVDALSGAMGQIMALTNMAGQVNGIATNVTQLSNSVAQIYASLATLQSVSNSLSSVASLMPMVSAIATNVGSIRWSDVTSLQTNLLTAMESKLGSEDDAPGSDTVFGQLYGIEKNLGSVGGSAVQAVKKANSAKTEAANAASAITQVKNSVASGQIPQIMNDLAALRKALGATMEQAGGVRESMGTDKLVQTLREAMEKIDVLAKGRGIKTLGQSDVEFKPGDVTDPQTVAKLMDKMAETKAMMEAMRLLMDEAVNKPVVVDWLEGNQ